jgi:hypothetical protein
VKNESFGVCGLAVGYVLS